MLQTMRNKSQGIVAYTLVGLIIVVFALFGADALFMGGLTQDTVAEVNGRKISEYDVARGLARQKQQLQSMLGDSIDPRFLSDEFLRPSVIESSIQREILAASAEQSGLRVGTVDLDKVIVADENFHRDGNFDSDFYTSLLRQYGYTPSSYRNELLDNRIIGQYQQTFTATAFATDKEALELARLQHETRSFAYVTLPLEKAMKSVTSSDEDLQAYYEKHKIEFMSQAQAAVEYVLLNKDVLEKSVTVSSENIQVQYAAELEAAKEKIERHAAHILIEEQEDGSHLSLLSDLQEKIKAGEDFSVLAKQYSADTGSAEQGGDVGITTGSNFVEEFENTLSLLSVGQVSEPVKTEFGYHIIKLLDQKEPTVPSLAESRERIAQELKQVVVEELYADKVEQMKESSLNAADLNQLAGDLEEEGISFSIEKTESFTQQNPMALYVGSSLLRNPQVLSEIFGNSDDVKSQPFTGKVTEVLELDENHAVVLRITEYTPAAEQALEIVKDNVFQQFQRETAAEQLALRASELLQKLLAKESLDDVAKMENLLMKHAGKKERTGTQQGGDVDSQILQKVFAIRKPSEKNIASDTVLLNNGDWVLIEVLKSHTPSADELNVEQKEQVTKRLQGNAGNQDFSVLLAMQTDQANIVRRSQPLLPPQ